MSDKCCCDDPKAPTDSTPSRTGGGSSLPKSEGATTGVQSIAGANGQNPDGTPNTKVLKTSSEGVLQIEIVNPSNTVDITSGSGSRYRVVGVKL